MHKLLWKNREKTASDLYCQPPPSLQCPSKRGWTGCEKLQTNKVRGGKFAAAV